MTSKTIDCTECGTSVPYGRLSCPACGALLASVTGGRPAIVLETPVASEPEPEPEFIESLAFAAPAGPDPAEPVDAPPPASEWPPLTESPPVLAGRPYPRFLIDDPEDRDLPTAQPPSTYRPSGLVLSGAVAGGAGWTAPAATASAVPVPETATTRVRSRVGPVDRARFVEIAGWFVVVGATMAVLGFLLPWSAVVIGARGVGSYFDQWGLASPTHVVVLATTMLVLALGILRTAVPTWIRSGVLPLALGSLLIGLVWPYQVGPLGADVGILVVALGGLALAIGGVVTTWATRHVGVDLLV
jgi:hypothetical protein